MYVCSYLCKFNSQFAKIYLSNATAVFTLVDRICFSNNWRCGGKSERINSSRKFDKTPFILQIYIRPFVLSVSNRIPDYYTAIDQAIYPSQNLSCSSIYLFLEHFHLNNISIARNPRTLSILSDTVLIQYRPKVYKYL